MSAFSVGDAVQHHGGDVFIVREVTPCPGDAEFHKHDMDTGPHDAVGVYSLFGLTWVCERRVRRLIIS